MIIILRSISASTRKQDIENFIEPAIKGGFLRKNGHIEKISILVLRDTRTNKVEYHGLVTIKPDVVANRVIKKLNRKQINGKRVLIREYQIRRWQNDPRINRRDQIQEYKDMRLSDRRLWRVKVDVKVEKDISELFSSEERFSRKFIEDTL